MSWLIYVNRSPRSIFGAAKTALKYASGDVKTWPSEEEAKAETVRLNKLSTSANIFYTYEEDDDTP